MAIKIVLRPSLDDKDLDFALMGSRVGGLLGLSKMKLFDSFDENLILDWKNKAFDSLK